MSKHTPGPCTACGADPIPRDCPVCGPWVVKSWIGDDARRGYFVARTSDQTHEWMSKDGRVARFDTKRAALAAIAKAEGAAA